MSAKEDLKGFDLSRLPELMNVDEERQERAKERQAAFWRRQTPEQRPIMASAELTPEQEAIPYPNFEEAFWDGDLMLCGQVRTACSVVNSGSEAVPSIRANMGTGVMLSCFGLKQDVFPDKMPWLREHLDKARISRLTPEDIKPQNDFELGMRHMRRFKELMGDSVAIYCMDTQGPLDLAHLLIGDDIFMEMHDDPPFVHHLMELCLQLGIKTHEWMKELAGEPRDRIYHGGQIYAENMGIRICEDTTAIIGPDHIHEFAMPYSRRLAQHFGGAWIHYCGRNDHLTDAILEIPEVRGINFGHIPGHEDDHDFEDSMTRCEKAGKAYFGSWPRLTGEGGEDYLRRLHRWSARGVLMPSANNAVGGVDGFADVHEALTFWRAL